MTFKSAYNSLLTALLAKVKTVSALNDNVGIGAKYEVTKYPICWISPGEILISETGVGSNQNLHTCSFEIVVMTRDENISQGQTTVMDIASDIYDALRGDRTLGGICRSATFISLRPDYALNYALHWCTLTVAYEVFETSPP